MTANDPAVPPADAGGGAGGDASAAAATGAASGAADPSAASGSASASSSAASGSASEHAFSARGGEAGYGEERESAEERGKENPLALKVEELILGAARTYTPFQAARAADVPMDLAARFWRAMGFADIGQARALTEADVLALRRLAGLVEAGLLTEATAIQVARSTGQTTARLAEWQVDSFIAGLTVSPEPGMSRMEVTYPLVELLLPELEEFLIYVWRRQLAAATGRVVQAQDDEEMVDRRLAVGFADLVGFTRLTRRLEEEELGELVEAFETTAADLVAAHGGRLIKTLGDEVLYVADEAGTAAEIGLRMIETLSGDETMPELRVGLAFGTVTTRMGDVFGNTVNLASRLTSIAPKDTVLIDGALKEELTAVGDAPHSEKDSAAGAGYRFALQPLYQRPVRGLGVVEPWLLGRRG
ncbi:adenylate/guanylate cyclase domain-containing protein [Streptomyces sp. JJ38]|uniref:adenylate/guanylate cyclase domain-containing protein n=1 Tax=Streptomyces sp. JJ38 TaxID=2738128 RepID=UPI001C55C7B6|nr:adenylate/guanylate cyclase domain-containing protein [Streptomyces sp. JJ38]MBW1596868.1 adenylate/guanylate cyclase domain-containing protein [Streptomyces sp. JJ38]